MHRRVAETKQYDAAMRRRRSPATGSVVLSAFVVLATGCGGNASGAGDQLSCEDLDKQSDVELVLCDDGETRIDRRSERPPATPEAERVE